MVGEGGGCVGEGTGERWVEVFKVVGWSRVPSGSGFCRRYPLGWEVRKGKSRKEKQHDDGPRTPGHARDAPEEVVEREWRMPRSSRAPAEAAVMLRSSVAARRLSLLSTFHHMSW